jgi:aspartyl-tRNA(Asn)/glutamyl-tRNA(Gln) amidotransferase subunit A
MLPTIGAASEDIRLGRVSPAALLDSCVERIERLESAVRAWAFLDFDSARAQAEVLGAELKRGKYRGPLHGIPIGVKDIFDIFDWPTAAGSRLWAQSIARRDATVVERLRQAGAIFLGKTVTTAYASFDPPPTRNPWNPSRTPAGSSSGSAVAVACGMCLASLGSQTGGSITRPASYCGVASCKPTFGRVSVDGVFPLAPSMDHVGPLGRSVLDLALILQCIAGPDPRDPTCATSAVPDYAQALAAAPAPPRLARARGMFEQLAEQPVRDCTEKAISRLRSRGAACTDISLPAGFADVISRHRIIMAVEAAACHGPRLARHPEDYPPKITALLQEGLKCLATEYARCKDHQRRLFQETAAVLEDFDALVVPATTSPAPDAGTTGDPAFNSPWSYTGLPTVSLPAGWTPDGLPLAIQLVGKHWSEKELFIAAAWCEAALEFEPRDPLR